MLEKRRKEIMNETGKRFEHYFTARPKSKPKLGLIRTHFRGMQFEFVTASGVFSKNRVDLGTRLLVDSMVLPKKGCVLDMGCGYGPIGIAAAVFNPYLQVFMIDVNIRAIRLARRNVEINNVDNVTIRRGKLYEPVEDIKFGCILTNPPVTAGMETVKAIICEAPKYMTSKATFQMVVRSKIAGKRLCAVFEEAFGNLCVLARGSGYRVLMSKKQ